MAVKFPCSACGRDVYSTKAAGEEARCACGADTPVPQDATAITYLCRTCGARGTTQTCAECGGSASPERLASTPGAPLVSPRRPSARYHDRERFQAGQVIGRGLRIWAVNLATFLPLALLVYVPYLAASLFLRESIISRIDIQDIFSSGNLVFFSTLFVEFLLNQLVTATIIFAVFQALRQRDVEIASAMRSGLAALPAVLGVSIVVGLMGAVGVFALLIPGMAAQSGFLTVIGFLGMIIFAGWFIARTYVAVPVAVVERPGVFASVSRSWNLSEGFRWRIFGIVLLMGFFNFLVNLVVTLFGMDQASDLHFTVSQGVGIVLASLAAVVVAVAYHDLRVAAEGVDVEDLAAVFE